MRKHQIAKLRDEISKPFIYEPIETAFERHMIEKGHEIDLFDKWDELPKEVQNIFDTFENPTHADCANMIKLLKPLGYTFDYGLDTIPYNLRKL